MIGVPNPLRTLAAWASSSPYHYYCYYWYCYCYDDHHRHHQHCDYPLDHAEITMPTKQETQKCWSAERQRVIAALTRNDVEQHIDAKG